MNALSSRLDAFEKVVVETITARFEETNGFVFEVLTALSAAPRCVHPFLSSQHRREEEKADKKISAASGSAEQKKRISTKPKKISTKEKASMGLRIVYKK